MQGFTKVCNKETDKHASMMCVCVRKREYPNPQKKKVKWLTTKKMWCANNLYMSEGGNSRKVP